MTDDLSFDDAVVGLRRGDFTRMTPIFGDPATPEHPRSRVVDWYEAGAFAAAPDALDEALTCACWLGRVGVAAYLLDRGVRPTAGTATGMDALHWAANRGQLAAVRLLLARGTPVDTISRFGGTVLATTTWSAVHEPRPEHLAIVDALLAAGATLDTVTYPTGHAAVDARLAPLAGGG